MSSDGWWRFAQDATVPDGTGSVSRDEQDAIDEMRRAFDPERVPTTDAFDAVVVVDFDVAENRWTVTHWTNGGRDHTYRSATSLMRAVRLARTTGAPLLIDGRRWERSDPPTDEQVRAIEAGRPEAHLLPGGARVRWVALPRGRRPPREGTLRVDAFHDAGTTPPSPGTPAGSYHVTGASRDEVLRWIAAAAWSAAWATIQGDPGTNPDEYLPLADHRS